MTSIQLTVNGAYAEANVSGVLTGGMVGIPIRIKFDSSWEGLDKTLVCKGAGQEISLVGIGTTATVAHEVMQAGSTLFLGIEGRNADGTLVIPTIWVDCGIIREGAHASDESGSDPTNPVWAQLQQQIGCLDELETQSKEDLVEAVNEALNSLKDKVGLTADEVLALILQQLDAYSWEESDPTVPDWAKASEKPTYTPNEIGAEKAGNVAAGLNSHNKNTAAHPDIRSLISAIVVPSKVSELTNDAGYLTAHQDVSHLATAKSLTDHSGNTQIHVSASEKAAWNQKSEFSGSYNDLTNKPTIPTVPSKLSGFTNDLYTSLPLDITYEDGTVETVNMVVTV